MKRVCALNVALQLEGCGKLAVAVLASGVLLPALTALLLKFQMVFHVVHKPVKDCQQVQRFKLKHSKENLKPHYK